MKKSILFCLFLVLFAACKNEKATDSLLVVSDLDNFWVAYDEMKKTTDSIEQLQILNKYFIDKASLGQEKLFEVRRYTPEEYVSNIRNYPGFYESVRKNMGKIKTLEPEIEKSLQAFKKIYPKMKEAHVYLGVGNYRTPGTTVGQMVLIGSEMSLTDANTNTTEFPERLDYFKNYTKENPIHNFGFLCAHEFVHTQQTEAMNANLLSKCLREGSAEYMAVLTTGKASTIPGFPYGEKNKEKIYEQFKKEMFNNHHSYWLWSSQPNRFGHRDLGYFVGYQISDHHYKNSKDKNQALADLIELDYADVEAVKAFVDKIGFFEQPLSELEKEYQKNQPEVIKVEQDKELFTLHFSEAMNPDSRGFDYGPLGEDHVLSVSEIVGFNEDSTVFVFTAKVTPEKEQQVTVTHRFLSANGVELKPYLISINKK